MLDLLSHFLIGLAIMLIAKHTKNRVFEIFKSDRFLVGPNLRVSLDNEIAATERFNQRNILLKLVCNTYLYVIGSLIWPIPLFYAVIMALLLNRMRLKQKANKVARTESKTDTVLKVHNSHDRHCPSCMAHFLQTCDCTPEEIMTAENAMNEKILNSKKVKSVDLGDTEEEIK